MPNRFLVIALWALGALGTLLTSAMSSAVPDLMAQTSAPAALSGVVSSQQEGLMEGVVVSARCDDANFTVSVVSDAQGKYSFPRAHLQPGKYALTIRAVGYDLSGPASVIVAESKPAIADLKLVKARDLAAQLSSLEWAMSVPGTPEQKDKVIYQTVSCAYCHTWQRVVRSNHTADEFVDLITRMQKYYTDGSAVSTDHRGRGQLGPPDQVAAADTNPIWGREPFGVPKKDLAEYLATINLSGGKTTWPYELKTLPRPKGKATRVIITQYDMPRPDTVAHDLDLDSSGTVWYTDESRMFFGKMDPKTGAFTEFVLPPVPPGDLPGARDIQVDRDDNLWFPRRIASAAIVMTKFNPKTQEVSTIEGVGTQFMTIGPEGKIWAGWSRIDPKTMKVEATFSWEKSPNLPPGPHRQYVDLTVVNSKGNPYAPDIGGSYIIGIDAKTGEPKFFQVPTPRASPRRGRMDAEDRFWFAEYTGDKIGMFDTRTEKFQEWPMLRKYTTPYAVSAPDKNGYVYATSNMSERLIRLDPRTGEIVEYQMPTEFDSKKIAYDPTTSRTTLWMCNTRTARMMKVEPLD
ncbi:MAG: carboxypeptidase regulatory-like domain-containing protein [Acidobacteriia bacterium]|nr:carboxypeptidase regulatory-like domain-containing protein [Terriglobia bacterium]